MGKNSSRDINKRKYLQEYKHTSKNISGFIKVRKNETSKTYVKGQCLNYTETIRNMQKSFWNQTKVFNVHLSCPLGTDHFT